MEILKSAVISSMLIVLFSHSCTTQQSFERETKKSLEGEWELIESYHNRSGISLDPDIKVYKIINGDHWAVAGHSLSGGLNWGIAGSFRITKETYVEYLETVRNPDIFGDSLVYRYTLYNDTLLLLRPGVSERWKKIK